MADAHSTTEYRDVPGFEGYRVGSDGSVWSCRDLVSLGRKGTRSVLVNRWSRLSPSRAKVGYRLVGLRKGGRTLSQTVHRLVLLAFVGNPPAGHVCRHLNGDKGDNRLENLAWGTYKENAADMFRHGTARVGERVHSARLTNEQVREVRVLLGKGEGYASVGSRFGVDSEIVRLIAVGKTWKHVK